MTEQNPKAGDTCPSCDEGTLEVKRSQFLGDHLFCDYCHDDFDLPEPKETPRMRRFRLVITTFVFLAILIYLVLTSGYA